MNELTPHAKALETGTEVHALKPKEQEYKLIGKARHIPGLKFWSMDADGVIEELRIDRLAYVGMDGEQILKQRATIDPRKRYCQALNIKNAKRKFSL